MCGEFEFRNFSSFAKAVLRGLAFDDFTADLIMPSSACGYYVQKEVRYLGEARFTYIMVGTGAN